MSTLNSVTGDTSSKRVMGTLYLLAGLFIVSYKELKSIEITNPEMLIGIFVTGGGLLGLGVIEYFSNLKKKSNGA